MSTMSAASSRRQKRSLESERKRTRSSPGFQEKLFLFWLLGLLLRSLGVHHVLDLIVGGLRNDLFPKQVLLRRERTRVDDALREVRADAGQCSQIFLTGRVQIDGLPVCCWRVSLFGRVHLVSFGRIGTLIADRRRGLLLLILLGERYGPQKN